MAALGGASTHIPDIFGDSYTDFQPNIAANPDAAFLNSIRYDSKMRSHNIRAAVRAAENPKGELAAYDKANEDIGKLNSKLGVYISTDLSKDIATFMPYATVEERNIAWYKLATHFHNSLKTVVLGQDDFNPARRVASAIGVQGVGVSSGGVMKKHRRKSTRRSKRG